MSKSLYVLPVLSLLLLLFLHTRQSNIEVMDPLEEAALQPAPESLVGSNPAGRERPDIEQVTSAVDGEKISLPEPPSSNDSEHLFANFFEAAGYQYLHEYADSESLADVDPANDYVTYDLDTLHRLAMSGDGIAQLYYGLSIKETQPEAALDWLQQAAISTGYTGAGMAVANVYLDAWKQLEAEFRASAEEVSYAEIAALEARKHGLYEKALSWMAYGAERGDPIAAEAYRAIGQHVQNHPELFGISGEVKLDDVLGMVEAERNRRGLPSLQNFQASLPAPSAPVAEVADADDQEVVTDGIPIEQILFAKPPEPKREDVQ